MASSAATRTFQDALDEALNAMRTANPEHAVAMCDELLNASAYPDAVRALRLRGQAQEAMGDVMRASLDYERVLEICPTDTITALSYAKALSKLGRKEEAALFAHQLLDWMPNDAEAQRIASEGVAVQAYDAPRSNGRLAAAQAQFAVGRTQLALTTVRKVVADALDRADARLMLATFLWRDSQRIQAAEQCQQLLDDEPDCLLAHALLVYIWHGTDALQQWHARSVDRLDPDHREVIQTLVPARESALFEVAEVPSVPPVAGFAEEDIHDVSDDPDHDDFMDRLMASAGPINATHADMAAQLMPGTVPGTQPGPTPAQAPANPRYPTLAELDNDDDIASYSKLDWEPESDEDASEAINGNEANQANQANEAEEVDEADTPPPWLTQVSASSRPTPEGAIADALDDDVSDEDTPDNPSPKDLQADDEVKDQAETVEGETGNASSESEPASNQAGQAGGTQVASPSDPGAWLEAARAAINQRMTINSAESQSKMIELAERMNAALADLQTLANTQPDPEWYTLLGMAYTIKGKVDAALAEYQQGPSE